jgi:hypothetical protein
MLDVQNVKVRLTKTNEIIIKAAAIIGAITVIAGGYTFYLNNIWKPKVEVVSVDFKQGILEFKFQGKTVQVFGDSNYYLAGDWSIQLGSTNLSGENNYDRIQLLKKGMVVEYLKK